MTFVVVDASVASKWLLSEPDSDVAASWLADDLIAPDLLRLECASAILRRVRIRQFNDAEARRRLAEIALMPVRIFPVDEGAAIDLALALSHSLYDCCYLALALAQNVQLVTADDRFRRAAEAAGLGASVRPLGPYTP